MTKRSYVSLAVALITVFSLCNAYSSTDQVEGPIPVKVIQEDDGQWRLYRADQPYFVNGAGAQRIGLGSVAERGGNSIRTWWIDMAEDQLDEAHRHGLTVALCLPIAAERFGLDYRDPQVLRDVLNQVESAVQRYKNHPAFC